MKELKLYKLLGLLLAFFLSGAVCAAPRVVVSVAPLHSLVSALMQDVGEPILLFEQGVKTANELDVFQKGRLITADILVWSGAGLEAPLAQALEQSPMLQQKQITLSSYVPLLRRAGYTGMDVERDISRDSAFFSDPRLAIMAVRMLTPRLVRLDPDHTETYLDNEIRLIKQLKGLEQEISGLFKPYHQVSAASLADVDQYFGHRYLNSMSVSADGMGEFYKVSNRNMETCAHTNKTEKASLGPNYYFDTMRQTAHHLVDCMQRLDPRKTAANKQAVHIGES